MPKPSHNSKVTEIRGKEIGRVISFFSGVVKIQGLPEVFLHEVLLFEDGTPAALVIGFNERFVEAAYFDQHASAEQPLYRSFKTFQIPLSDGYTGRIVDGFGRPIDGLGDISGEPSLVFREAVPIIDRMPVTVPLSTGIKVIDASLPLGRGQRELIIGDRKLGKTSIAADTVLNQHSAETPVRCVYVVCGKKEEDLYDLISLFKTHNAFLYTTIVAATAASSFTEQYLAPFVGCTIAEHFRDNGQDALVVYDDLSQHAKAYRSISLLLERAPGRETYPGDIFSLHGGLLERAARLSKEKGGGSLTALPIVETQEDDITSFIPTNLISITDGQIYLDRSLFQKGFLPAVNIGLSVSRIGSQAQPKALAEVVRGIRLTLTQQQELQKISQLESHLSADAEQKLKRGSLLIELLKQDKRSNVSWPEQVILFYSINRGLLDDIDPKTISDSSAFLSTILAGRYADVLTRIKSGAFDEKVKADIDAAVQTFKREFVS
jgi:F-type H+-transporting ATPase subunit alpha